MDIVRDIAAILGVILSAASVLTLLSKSVRRAVVGFLNKRKETNKVFESIAEIRKMLEEHITQDKIFKENATAFNEINVEFMRNQCRNNIKNIFYKYKETKVLPLYEKKTLLTVEPLYLQTLHGNSFASLLLEEMATWDVDYESPDPYEDEA